VTNIQMRNEQISELTAQNDNPDFLASTTFRGILYGHNSNHGHPISGNIESVSNYNTSTIREQYKNTVLDSKHIFIATGDFDRNDIIKQIDELFGSPANAAQESHNEISNPSIGNGQKPTEIHIVDRPGAAQSVIRAGHVTLDRLHEDYYAMAFVNYVLGGDYSSRLNLNLRQDKGYSYGYRSWIDWHKKSSLFGFGGAVETDVTGNALNETIKEARRIIADTPVSRNEFESAKAGLIREFPSLFETQGQILEGLAQIVSYDLPDDYYNHIIDEIASTSLEDVNRVAKEILSKDRLVTLLVGDRSVIEEQIKTLGWDICLLDHNGRIITN